MILVWQVFTQCGSHGVNTYPGVAILGRGGDFQAYPLGQV